jgi:hypothetical protein
VTSSGFDPLTLPYTGPSRVPLLSIWELREQGRWTAPPNEPPRDTSNDMTDEQITKAIAGAQPVRRATAA